MIIILTDQAKPGHYVDGQILASFFFGEFMDLDSVHRYAKKNLANSISSYLDLTLGQ